MIVSNIKTKELLKPSKPTKGGDILSPNFTFEQNEDFEVTECKTPASNKASGEK